MPRIRFVPHEFPQSWRKKEEHRPDESSPSRWPRSRAAKPRRREAEDKSRLSVASIGLQRDSCFGYLESVLFLLSLIVFRGGSGSGHTSGVATFQGQLSELTGFKAAGVESESYVVVSS